MEKNPLKSSTILAGLLAIAVGIAMTQGWLKEEYLTAAMSFALGLGLIGQRRATGQMLKKGGAALAVLAAGACLVLVDPHDARAEGLPDHEIYAGVTPLGFAIGGEEIDGEYLGTAGGFYKFPWGVIVEYQGGAAGDGEGLHFGRVGFSPLSRGSWHLLVFGGARGSDGASPAWEGSMGALYDFTATQHVRLMVDVDQEGAVVPAVGYFVSE